MSSLLRCQPIELLGAYKRHLATGRGNRETLEMEDGCGHNIVEALCKKGDKGRQDCCHFMLNNNHTVWGNGLSTAPVL